MMIIKGKVKGNDDNERVMKGNDNNEVGDEEK